MHKLLFKLVLGCVLLFFATQCFAEWDIVSVTTEPFERESRKGKGAPEMEMVITIRNISDRDIHVWGQTFGTEPPFYLIESFIRNGGNQVWERQNVGICGSFGDLGWITVKPDQKIEIVKVLFREYEGRDMILTFRRAHSKGANKGEEVLLGPFVIPKANESKQKTAPGAPSARR